MMNRLGRVGVTVAVAAGLVVGVPATVSAGVPTPDWIVTDDLDGYVDELVIEIDNVGADCDADPAPDVDILDDEGIIANVPLSSVNGGTVTVPDAVTNTVFGLQVNCFVEGSPVVASVYLDEDAEDPIEFDYAGLDVTKAVEGDAGDAAFTIEVACEGAPDQDDTGPYDLSFSSTGGTNRVWFSNVHVCELTETEDGGAASTTIVSEDCVGEGEGGPGEGDGGNGAEIVGIFGPVICDATVTNTFATTPTTPTPTTDPPGVSPDTSAPARPTSANPDYTG